MASCASGMAGKEGNDAFEENVAVPGCSLKTPDVVLSSDVVSCEVKPLSKRKNLYEWEKGSYSIKQCPDALPHKCVIKESKFSRVVCFNSNYPENKAVYYNTPWKKNRQIKSKQQMKKELGKRYKVSTVDFLMDFDVNHCRCPD